MPVFVLNTAEDILKNMGKQTFVGPHWIALGKKCYGSQRGPETVGYIFLFNRIE